MLPEFVEVLVGESLGGSESLLGGVQHDLRDQVDEEGVGFGENLK